MKWLVLAFVVLPTTELALLIYSGQQLGFLTTVLIIMLTGVGGAYFAKRQGLRAWSELQKRMQYMETPGDAMIDSVCILLGGILLITPGFISDIMGFLLLFSGPRNLIRPTIQRWIYRKMKNGQIVIR